MRNKVDRHLTQAPIHWLLASRKTEYRRQQKSRPKAALFYLAYCLSEFLTLGLSALQSFGITYRISPLSLQAG